MSPFLKEYEGDENDDFLVNEAKTGNRKALEKLLLKHQPYIYNIAWRMVRQPGDAEDLTQEVNVKIITKLSEFQGRSSFRTWLYRIAMNHFLNGYSDVCWQSWRREYPAWPGHAERRGPLLRVVPKYHH